jgi:hypothetical protein
MTIDSSYYVELYAEDDDVTYPFSFEVISDAECVGVYRVTTAGARVLIPDTDYTLVFNTYRAPMADGGVIVLDAPLADGETLSVERSTPITNDQVFANNTPFSGEAFEFQIDKITMILQEIEGHICNCADNSSPLPPAVVPLVSATELMYFGAVYSNEADSHPQVVSSDDGQIIVLNRLGNSNVNGLAYSIDGGANFSLSAVMGAGSATLHSLQYDSATGRVWAWTSAAGDGKLWYSNNNGATWTELTTPGSGGTLDFNHSFCLTDAGEIFFLRSVVGFGGSPNSSRLTKFAAPPGDTTYISSGVIDPSNDPTVNEIRGWRGYDLLPGSGRILMRAEADYTLAGPYYPYFGFFFNTSGWVDDVDVNDSSLGMLFLDNKFVYQRSNAYNKLGNMIQLRSHVSNISTFDSISHDYSGVAAFPTFTVDWGVPVKNICMTYSAVLGGYVLSAEDVVTIGGYLHLRYNSGTNFTVWNTIPKVKLSRYPVDYDARQLYWSHDNVYIYGYFTTGNVSVFDKITVYPSLPAPFTGVLVHTHLDAKVGNDYQSEIGGAFQSTLPVTADAKYGGFAMGYTNLAGATLQPTVALNVQDFTVRLYHKPQAKESVSPRVNGIWSFGAVANTTNLIHIVVDWLGNLVAECFIGTVSQWKVSTPITIPAVDYLEIELEVCFETDTITLFVDGVVRDTDTWLQRLQVWPGTYEMWLGASGWSTNPANIRYAYGPTDEVQIVNRSIWKGLSHAASTGPYT